MCSLCCLLCCPLPSERASDGLRPEDLRHSPESNYLFEPGLLTAALAGVPPPPPHPDHPLPLPSAPVLHASRTGAATPFSSSHRRTPARPTRPTPPTPPLSPVNSHRRLSRRPNHLGLTRRATDQPVHPLSALSTSRPGLVSMVGRHTTEGRTLLSPAPANSAAYRRNHQ